MYKILFVCTANQFRSPIAAAHFTRKLNAIGEGDNWMVGSAGTWTPEGFPAHPKAIEAAEKLDLDLSDHRTREVNADLLTAADLVVVMEPNHKEAIEVEFSGLKGRVVLLGNVADISGGEISDPARDNFAQADAVASLVCSCMDKAFSELLLLASVNYSRKSGN